MILVKPQVVHIRAEVDVKASVAIVVSYCCMGECSFRSARKLEGIALERKRSVSLD